MYVKNAKVEYKPTGYFLIFLGYFSLMFSVGLQYKISESLNVSAQDAHFAISILFITFSFSAITVTCLSDIYGSFKVLKYSQLLSILGLCIAFLSDNINVLYIAFLFIGLGTGSYPGIARSLITRHVKDNIELKKTYAILSALLVCGPTLGTLFGNYMSQFSVWKYSYLMVAVAEIILLFYSQHTLFHDFKSQQLVTFSKIYHIILVHIKNIRFILSVLTLSLCYSTYIQVILVNLSAFIERGQGLSYTLYYWIAVILAIIYIFSTILVGRLAHLLHKKRVKVIMLGIILLGIILFSIHFNWIVTILGICVITFGIGFLGPMSTSLGMVTISIGYGIASAMITFTNSLTSALLTLLEARLSFSSEEFMLVAFYGIFLGLVLLTVLGFLVGKNKANPS